MRPTEGVQFRDVYQFAHRTVWLAGIKLHIALEANGLYDKFRQLADCEFLASADIDMAVAYLAQRRYGTTATGGVIPVHCSVC